MNKNITKFITTENMKKKLEPFFENFKDLQCIEKKKIPSLLFC